MVSDVTLQSAIEAQSQTTIASAGLADDFGQFLQLLTVQLQNQDPLSPMDTTEFTNQLVAFTGVEQQINTNQKLDSLVALQLGNSLSAAQSYVGSNITYISSEFNFDGAPTNLRYSMPSTATDTTLRILNDEGRVVYEEEVSGNLGGHEFEWDGRLNGGGIAADGTYQIQIDALDSSGQAVTATTAVTGLVRGVESQNGQTLLLVGERAVALGNVLNTSAVDNTGSSDSISAALDYIGLDITYQDNEILLTNDSIPSIDYTLPEDADRARIKIYDDQGKLVHTDYLKKTVATDDTPSVGIDEVAAGDHTYVWENASEFTAGEYTFEIDAIAQGKTLLKDSGLISYDGTDDLRSTYNLPETADDVIVEIFDADGNLVKEDTADKSSGSQTYVLEEGELPAGEYQIVISTIDDTDRRIATSTSTTSNVTGIQVDNGVVFLQVTATKYVPLSEVDAVSVPETEEEDA